MSNLHPFHFLHLLLIALILSSAGARAEEVTVTACPVWYRKLGQTVSGRSPEKSQLERELQILNQRTVREIFPEDETILVHGVSVKRIKISDADEKKFQAHFDNLWNKRQAAGLIPAWELKAYRKWLNALPETKGAYPPLDDALLMEKYISRDGTMTEYIDSKFLEYLKAVKFHRRVGQSTEDAMENYFKTVDRSLLSHLGRAALAKGRALGTTFVGGAATSAIVLVTAFPGEIVNAALNPWIQPIKDFYTKKTKAASQQVAESVRDWAKIFGGSEEEYVAALVNLRTITSRLEQVVGPDCDLKQKTKEECALLHSPLDNRPRAESTKVIEDYLADTAKQLPRFHGLVMEEQKDFESVWDKRLAEHKEAVPSVVNSYSTYKVALDLLKNKIQGSGTPASPEESALLANYQHEVNVSEDYLAEVLADWLFYKQARGEKKLDAGLNRNFAAIYEKYIRNMSMSKLARAVNTRVKLHLAQLETYSKKSSGKKPDPSPGATPAPKPEDQLGENSPAPAEPPKAPPPMQPGNALP